MKFLAAILLFISFNAQGDCFIQGTYSIQINNSFSQPQFPIRITGFINSGIATTYINWQAQFMNTFGRMSYYSIDEFFHGERLKLQLSIDTWQYEYELSGMIHGQNIKWVSTNNWIRGDQPCIP